MAQATLVSAWESRQATELRNKKSKRKRAAAPASLARPKAQRRYPRALPEGHLSGGAPAPVLAGFLLGQLYRGQAAAEPPSLPGSGPLGTGRGPAGFDSPAALFLPTTKLLTADRARRRRCRPEVVNRLPPEPSLQLLPGSALPRLRRSLYSAEYLLRVAEAPLFFRSGVPATRHDSPAARRCRGAPGYEDLFGRHLESQ